MTWRGDGSGVTHCRLESPAWRPGEDVCRRREMLEAADSRTRETKVTKLRMTVEDREVELLGRGARGKEFLGRGPSAPNYGVKVHVSRDMTNPMRRVGRSPLNSPEPSQLSAGEEHQYFPRRRQGQSRASRNCCFDLGSCRGKERMPSIGSLMIN